jgi:hypothetical protein
MSYFEKFIANLKKSPTYDSFRSVFLQYLIECKERMCFYDDFEEMCDLIDDKAMNRQWLFIVYCELFSNYDYTPFATDRDMRFQLYLHAIEKPVYYAEDYIDSDDAEKVEVSEMILCFFFSFLQVKNCWWMFDHHFITPDDNIARDAMFFKYFNRVRGYDHLFLNTDHVAHLKPYDYFAISPSEVMVMTNRENLPSREPKP